MNNHPLVVGVDGTPASVSALAEAVRLAQAQTVRGGLDLVVVFVRQTSWAAISVDASVGLNEALDDMESDVRRIAGDALAGTDLSWRFEVREGDPGHELVHVATSHGAQTIVVGGHRHGHLGAALTRAVNTELVHGFEGSLMIVRPPLDGETEPSVEHAAGGSAPTAPVKDSGPKVTVGD